MADIEIVNYVRCCTLTPVPEWQNKIIVKSLMVKVGGSNPAGSAISTVGTDTWFNLELGKERWPRMMTTSSVPTGTGK